MNICYRCPHPLPSYFLQKQPNNICRMYLECFLTPRSCGTNIFTKLCYLNTIFGLFFCVMYQEAHCYLCRTRKGYLGLTGVVTAQDVFHHFEKLSPGTVLVIVMVLSCGLLFYWRWCWKSVMLLCWKEFLLLGVSSISK